jgi:hypothetical protein
MADAHLDDGVGKRSPGFLRERRDALSPAGRQLTRGRDRVPADLKSGSQDLLPASGDDAEVSETGLRAPGRLGRVLAVAGAEATGLAGNDGSPRSQVRAKQLHSPTRAAGRAVAEGIVAVRVGDRTIDP